MLVPFPAGFVATNGEAARFLEHSLRGLVCSCWKQPGDPKSGLETSTRTGNRAAQRGPGARSAAPLGRFGGELGRGEAASFAGVPRLRASAQGFPCRRSSHLL